MTNPPGAMPPLPEPKVLRLVDNEGFSDEAPYIWGFFAHGYDTGMEPYFSDDQLHAYAKAYAAPLIARVAELERQNEAQKDEWLSWEAKRAALEKDAARYRLVRRGQHWSVIDGIGNTLRADELDKQVDAAIAAKD